MNKPKEINLISNKIKLNAWFYEGNGKGNKPTIIWLHGIPGGREVGKSEISLDLSKAGMNVLRFNFTGLWGNKGKFTMSNALKDLTAAMDFLNTKENIKQLKIDSGKIMIKFPLVCKF